MKPGILAALIVGLLLVVGGLAFVLTANSSTPENQTDTGTTPITSSEVASHNRKNDCWTIIDGSVYDLTSYIARHPGGDEILRACGNDATTLFTTRTDADGETVGSGEGHSDQAQSQLERLKIGVLKK